MTAQCALIQYLDGDAKDFLHMLDALLGREQDPDTLQVAAVLRFMDFRRSFGQNMKAFLDTGGRLKLRRDLTDGQIRLGMSTAAMPLAHRALMDRSDMARRGDEGGPAYVEGLRRVSVPFLGEEHDVLLDVQLARALYEQDALEEACQYASGARSRLGACSAETRFCADMIWSVILRAMGRMEEAERAEKGTERWIRVEGLLQFRPNFRAWGFARRIAAGDGDAAEEWLASYAVSLSERPPLYRMYQHFVTERALLATGRGPLAVAFGEKLLRSALDFRRRLDVIEASILLAAAYRAVGDRRRAVSSLGRALRVAAPFGFTRRFIEDGALISPVLGPVLRGRAGRRDGWLAMARRLRDALSPVPEVPALNGRERDILALLDGSASYREIAARLGVALPTAKYHIFKLYRKLRAKDAKEALARAKEMELLGPTPGGA